MTPDKYQELALKTWYKPDNPLYLDPRHPLIKLAGEAGELLDLYGKHEYKLGFDWWDCKHCKKSKSGHIGGLICYHDRKQEYTPLVLDELGDWWYYLRIVCFIYGQPTEWMISENYHFWAIDKLLALMAQNSAVMLNDWLDKRQIDGSRLKVLWGCFEPLLAQLDCTLDHLTDLNYAKLNSEATAHGWREAVK